MLASIHRLIESALELDHTLSLMDRETILNCCRSPARFRERAKGPEERLLRVSQVVQMLATSRTTIWTPRQKTQPVPIGDSTKFRKAKSEPDGGKSVQKTRLNLGSLSSQETSVSVPGVPTHGRSHTSVITAS